MSILFRRRSSQPSHHTPTTAIALARHHSVRPWVALCALTGMLGTQWFMPDLFTLQAAQADELHQAKVAEARDKAPEWYVKAVSQERQTEAQMRLAKVAPAAAAAPASTVAPLPGLEPNAQPQELADAQNLARLARLPGGRRRASRPGEIVPSAPLYAPNAVVTTRRLNLRRAPKQTELSAAGQLRDALAPTALADPDQLAGQLDQDLKQQGIAGGLASSAGENTVAGQKVKAHKERLKRLQDINLSFGEAMQAWNDRDFKRAVTLLHQHVQQYGDSPWAAESLLMLSDEAKSNGRATEAQALLERVIQGTPSAAFSNASNGGKQFNPGFEAHQKAKERWADLHLMEGDYATARPVLQDILKNDLHWRRRTWAAHWLMRLERQGDAVTTLAMRSCGAQAVAAVLEELHRPQEAAKVSQLLPKNQAGFSLADLQVLATRNGAPMRGFRARPEELASLPLPLVLHCQTGQNRHFLVAQSIDAEHGMVHLLNPQDGSRYEQSYGELAREWSGAGLMLTKVAAPNLAQGQSVRVAWLSASEMQRVRGTGAQNSCQDGLGCPLGPYPKVVPSTVKRTCNCQCQSLGEPAVSVNPITQNVFINDAPLWHSPAMGPSVLLKMSYNSDDASSTNGNNFGFGNKWSFNYGTYIVENENGRVTIFMPDGEQDIYTPIASGSSQYDSEAGNFNRLEKTSNNAFTLTFQDGSKLFYGLPKDAQGNAMGQQPFLLEQQDRWGKSLVFGYDANVHLTTITDATGHVTTLTYDSNGHILRATDPFERHADFSYDSNGNMVQAIDMEGHAFQYTYDDMVDVVQLNTAQGPWTFQTIHYSDDHTDPNFGQMNTTYWDPMQDKPARFWYDGRHYVNGVAHTPQYGYTDQNGVTTTFHATTVRGATYSEGNYETGQYHEYGVKSEISDITYPDGEYASFAYDPVTTQLKTMQDQNNFLTEYTYGVGGRIESTRVSRSEFNLTPHTATYAYASNAANDPASLDVTSVTDTLGQAPVSVTYDSYHQPHVITVSEGGRTRTTTVTYMPWGTPYTVTVEAADSPTQVTTYNYDVITGSPTYGRLLSIDRDGVRVATCTYDTIGHVHSVKDMDDLTVSYEYNNIDGVTRVNYPDGTYSSVEYVCCGMPGMTRDRSGRKTYYDYDPLKRLVRVQDTAGNSVGYDYDAVGNMVRLSDSKGNLTHWTYDNMNRMTKKSYADGSYESPTYGSGGLLISSRNARGIVKSYSYDDWDRVQSVTYPNILNAQGQSVANPLNVSMDYDGLDRPVHVTDQLGTTTYGYDGLSRVTSVDGPWANDTLTYHYDNLGRRDSMSLNNTQQVSYGYDALARVHTLSSTFTGVPNTWTYDYVGNTGRLATLTRPNLTTTTYGYADAQNPNQPDPLLRLTSVQNSTHDGTNISRYAYAFDPQGQPQRDLRISMDSQVGTDPAQHVNYGYDNIDQLTGEVSTEAQPLRNISYGYDAMGNRTNVTNAGQTGPYSDAYASNKLNEVTSVTRAAGEQTTTTPFAYDAAGNLISSGGATYTYDEMNRLSQVVQHDAQGNQSHRSVFMYDFASRLRVSTEYDSNNNLLSQTRRVYDGMNVIQERDGNNNVTVNYTRGGNIGGLLSRSTAQGDFYYHYDGNGNVTQLTDVNQNTVASYSYDAYGNPITINGAQSDQPYRFSTKELLLWGLYNYGYRFYNAGMGRWINRDPIQEAGGLNLYAFVDNGVTNQGDDFGLLNHKGSHGGYIENYSDYCVEVLVDYGDGTDRTLYLMTIPPGYKSDNNQIDVDYPRNYGDPSTPYYHLKPYVDNSYTNDSSSPRPELYAPYGRPVYAKRRGGLQGWADRNLPWQLPPGESVNPATGLPGRLAGKIPSPLRKMSCKEAMSIGWIVPVGPNLDDEGVVTSVSRELK